MKNSAIVLLSGGQDSTTCLFWALAQYEEVKAIGFDYGQRHKVELEQAQKIADLAGVPFEVIDIKGTMKGSSLVDHSQDVSAPHELNPELPSSFTPGRNALFLTLAASRAFLQGIPNIVTGVCQTDYSGYPDCRRVFIDSITATLSLAMGMDFKIHTPLMYLTKAETWKLAKALDKVSDLDVYEIVRTMTMTDYNGNMAMNEFGMGARDNPATELRAQGYEEALTKGWLA